MLARTTRRRASPARRAAAPPPPRSRTGSPARAEGRTASRSRRTRPRTRPGAALAVEASKLVVHPAVELGIERRPGRSERRRTRRDQRHASHPSATAPRPSPRNGSTHASRLNPFFDGSARIAGPNWATSFRLISLFVSPATIRAEMNTPDAVRDRRARLVERRLAGRAHHLALELAEGRVALARERPARRARAPTAATSERSHVASARRMPACSLAALISPATRVADEAAAAVDEERLREAGDAVLRQRRRPGPSWTLG